MGMVRSGITPGDTESTTWLVPAPGDMVAAVQRHVKLALLAFVLGSGTAGATTTPSVQTAPGRHDAGAVVDQRIRSECGGLSGVQRHECVFDVVARDRKRGGTAAN